MSESVNILIAQDYKGLDLLISEVLELQGYQAEVINGKELILRLRSKKTKLLIISDKLLLANLELFEGIAIKGKTKLIVTIAIEDFQRIKQLKLLGYKLIKMPFDINELTDAVNQILDIHSRKKGVFHLDLSVT